jgi:hypothetical protein
MGDESSSRGVLLALASDDLAAKAQGYLPRLRVQVLDRRHGVWPFDAMQVSETL